MISALWEGLCVGARGAGHKPPRRHGDHGDHGDHAGGGQGGHGDHGASSGGGEHGAGQGRRRKAKSGGRSVWGTIAKWLFLIGIWGGIALGAVIAFFAYDLPDVAQVAQHPRRPSITLLAADGSLFLRHGDTQGRLIDAATVPRHVVGAVLATEDRRFFSHFGIDPIGLARAVVTNFRSGRTVQGGSTLTQQLAKNLFLNTERTLKRKVQEALLALWLEHVYTKNQILSAYLNRVYLGSGTYGFEAAAWTYFNKSIYHVDVYEAAMLAGLLKAPSRYSPVNNPDEAEQRAQTVLSVMADAGYLSGEELARLLLSPSPARKRQGPGGEGRYFADWIADQLGAYIGREPRDVVVRTTLDLRMQRAAEARLTAILDGPGKLMEVGQAALVALAPDGSVRALVGGRDYSLSQFNRATTAARQPGSAFKPFVYLAALEAGLTPETLVEDAPIRIRGWSPANFEKEFRGPIPLREALAHSVNTSAVRVLERAGIDRTRTLARRLGIQSSLGRDLSLALGTSEVTLMELTGAYAGLARGGVPVQPHAIVEIRDPTGQVLYKRRGSSGESVVAQELVGQLTAMMAGVLESGTGKAARLDRPAAGKTGTTQDYHDAWFVGFSADLIAGVWMGNDNNDEMKKVTGGSLPAKLWREFMLDAHAGAPVRPLPFAPGVATPPPAPAVALPRAGTGAVVRPVPAPVPAKAQPGLGDLIERLNGGR
ncbi:penicillin-binding protein 1A [uncultured Gammaproteobacteria bacterium]